MHSQNKLYHQYNKLYHQYNKLYHQYNLKFHTPKNTTLHYQPVLAMDLVSLRMHTWMLLLTDELTYCSMGNKDKGTR